MMAQKDGDTIPRPDPQDDDDGLRKRLLKRVTVAGALVVALLAGLALFDGLYVQPDKPSQVARVEPSAKPAEEPGAKEKSAEEPVVDKAEVAKEVVAEPERTAEPTGTMPPARDERPLTPPATAHPAMLRPGEPVAVVVQKPEPASVLARVSSPAVVAAKPVPADTPAPVGARPVARVAEAVGQFLLQMGVFSSVANAEELRARLELAGVPARIEARVQVGPFATRQEAEQAREKLKSLGMDPGLIMAARK
jgi:cell division protein FtsN